MIEKVIPDTIATIYIEEGDQILRKEVKASPKIQVDRDYFRKLSWVLEHIWEKANDIPDRIIHYAEELEEKKMELYLKHNEEMMQFYQELCDWGKRQKHRKGSKPRGFAKTVGVIFVLRIRNFGHNLRRTLVS